MTVERATELLPYAAIEWRVDLEYASDAELEYLDQMLNRTLVNPAERLAFSAAISTLRKERAACPPKALTTAERAERKWTLDMWHEAEQQRLRAILEGR